MNNNSNNEGLGRSKMARRFVPIFAAVATVPLVITVLVLGKVGQQQIVSTAVTMQQIQSRVVQDAGQDFRRLGRETVRRSSAHMAGISRRSGQSASRRWKADQARAFSDTARDFTVVTHGSIEDALHQSLTTNQTLLSHVSVRMGTLFARSTQETQQAAGGKIERAMLDQMNLQMQVRAEQYAQQISSHIQEHQNYLALTAQMLDLRAESASGQKAILDALTRRYPLLTLVSVLNAQGQETAMSASDHVVTSADFGRRAQEPYFQKAMRDESYIGLDGPPLHGAAPVLRLAVPIERYKGKVIGVLAARLSLEDLWDSIRNTRIGRDGFAAVQDQRGHFLLSPPQKSLGVLLSRSAPVDPLRWRVVVAQPRAEVVLPIQALKSQISLHAQQALAQINDSVKNASQSAALQFQSEAERSTQAADGKVQAGVRRVFDHLGSQTTQEEQTELALMQRAMEQQSQQAQRENDRQTDRAAEAASHRLTRRVPALMAQALSSAHRRLWLWAVAILALSCAVSCGIALLLAERLARPILRLAQGTRAIAAGNLEKRVDEHAPDEIGDLAVAFNAMAASLQRSQADLAGAEAQLVQSAKLASLGTLSAGIAHELNQPVAIVRGLAQQLQEEPGLPPEITEDLHLIEGQTSRMMKIIKHLRTFCRAGAYEMTALDINQVLRDCFILIDAQLKAHDVAVHLELDDTVPPVCGDVNELEQVFLNLITNARDASEGRADAQLSIHSHHDGDQIFIEFRDNGPGVPSEVVDKIFDPFFTTKEPGKGTGLGLSISDGIIKKHGGRITCVNDGGAVFTIILPGASVDEAFCKAA